MAELRHVLGLRLQPCSEAPGREALVVRGLPRGLPRGVAGKSRCWWSGAALGSSRWMRVKPPGPSINSGCGGADSGSSSSGLWGAAAASGAAAPQQGAQRRGTGGAGGDAGA